jgi:hypothetical protein
MMFLDITYIQFHGEGFRNPFNIRFLAPLLPHSSCVPFSVDDPQVVLGAEDLQRLERSSAALLPFCLLPYHNITTRCGRAYSANDHSMIAQQELNSGFLFS